MLRRALTVLVFLASFVAFGEAASAGNEFLAHLVGHLYPSGESFACFSRQYSDTHLASHPDQQVTFIKALIGAHFAESRVPSQAGYYMYQVSLAFKFRGREETLTGVAECGDGTPKDQLRGFTLSKSTHKREVEIFTFDERDVVEEAVLNEAIDRTYKIWSKILGERSAEARRQPPTGSDEGGFGF